MDLHREGYEMYDGTYEGIRTVIHFLVCPKGSLMLENNKNIREIFARFAWKSPITESERCRTYHRLQLTMLAYHILLDFYNDGLVGSARPVALENAQKYQGDNKSLTQDASAPVP